MAHHYADAHCAFHSREHFLGQRHPRGIGCNNNKSGSFRIERCDNSDHSRRASCNHWRVSEFPYLGTTIENGFAKLNVACCKTFPTFGAPDIHGMNEVSMCTVFGTLAEAQPVHQRYSALQQDKVRPKISPVEIIQFTSYRGQPSIRFQFQNSKDATVFRFPSAQASHTWIMGARSTSLWPVSSSLVMRL